MGGDEIALFVLLFTLITAVSAVTLTWMRGPHRIAQIEAQARGGDRLENVRQVAMLTDENAGLKNQVERLEQRLAVLETIATDPAERTAREIEALR